MPILLKWLGTYIGTNTHIKELEIDFDSCRAMNATDTAFFGGLTRNTSINKLVLRFGRFGVGQVGQEILRAYQENNSHLTHINIEFSGIHAYTANLDHQAIATTLSSCTHLKHIFLDGCNITDGQLLPIVSGAREHLEMLNLNGNRIGNDGCEVLANLLQDPNSNLCEISISNNNVVVGIEGVTAFSNSLVNNKTLKILNLTIGIDLTSMTIIRNAFCRTLCNTSSIRDTYLSNHTLERLYLCGWSLGDQLVSFVQMNANPNKRYVAMKKILMFHSDKIFIDMKPFFEWDGEGEQNLKALPYVVAWLEDANAVADDDLAVAENYSIPSKKLSAIFQFAVAMPLFFYGIVLAGERSVVNSHADSVHSVLAVEGNDEQNQDSTQKLASGGWNSDDAVAESEASIRKKIDHNQLDQNKQKESTDGMMSSDEDVKMDSVETDDMNDKQATSAETNTAAPKTDTTTSKATTMKSHTTTATSTKNGSKKEQKKGAKAKAKKKRNRFESSSSSSDEGFEDMKRKLREKQGKKYKKRMLPNLPNSSSDEDF